MPRIDPESGLGLVTDVCLKRKIRTYVETVKEGEPGYKIYIREDIPLNRSDREACEALGVPGDIFIGNENGVLFLPSHMVDFVIENAFKMQALSLIHISSGVRATQPPAR